MTADTRRPAYGRAANAGNGSGRHPSPRALAMSYALIAIVAVHPALAQTVWTGAVDDDWDTAGNWDSGVVPTAADTVVVDTNPITTIGAGVTGDASHIIVGQTAPVAGVVHIVGGGTLTSATNNGNLLGFDTGAHGEILVSGAGSQWTANGPVLVGFGGEGYVFLNNDGVINGGLTVLGIESGSYGVASISGAGTQWINTGAFGVGDAGSALLSIGSGAYLENSNGVVAADSGATGRVSLTGASQWVNTAALLVGVAGDGEIEVSGGSTVDAQNVVLAGQPDATGSVRISGAGSQLNAANMLHVGFGGIGTLTIENGATVASVGDSVVGSLANSGGDVVLDNAAMAVGGNLHIGQFGAGSMTVGAGSTVTVTGMASVADQIGSSGTLLVDGSLAAASIDIGEGGLLGGSGTLTGPTSVSGTLAPGNSIGTLSITGNYTQAAGSTYEVEGNAAGQSDRLSVTGTATLNGGKVVFIPLPDYALGTTYTILTAAGGVNGAFDEATFSPSLFLGATLAYDPNNVFLTVAQTASFASAGATPNQTAAASGADSLGPGNAIWDAIILLGSQAQAQAAFDSLSGEVHVSAKTTLTDDSRVLRDAAMKRIREAFGDTAAGASPLLAYGEDNAALPPVPADPDRFTLWAHGFGAWATRQSDGNAARLSGSTGGAFMGGDAGFGYDWRLGVIAGYSHTAFSVADRASSGTSDNLHLGVYGGTRMGAIGIRFGGAYSWHNVSTSRTVAFPGFTDTLTARYGAGMAQLFAEAGYGIEAGSAQVEPFVNLAYVNHHTGAFTESGGTAALAAAASTYEATFATLGVRSETQFRLGGRSGRVHAGLGWRHAFGQAAPTTNFSFAGSAAFTIAGVPIARDAAVIEAGLNLDLGASSSLGLAYDGQIGSGTQSHGLKAVLAGTF